MIARRDLLATTVMSSLLGTGGGEAAPDISERTAEDMLRALRDIHDSLEAQRSFSEILAVRQRMIDHLHANAKFPDFVDVGVDVWFAVHDWHVRHLQPLRITRDANGRYNLAMLMTNLVLKQDSDRNFISIPYDNR